ncbi:hypothetical protein Acsp03_40720 [Actinomadura sp. NBRC 104412]|uniref:hypothetical protein n=1 Tax=Actinomadura sp. NBRC 104412 TaxID=3032203 RepID=UPI0024A1742B|nr:hypothetical protein [Actinomadura sp. NBRC 104412]GLZ06606.1 hypothetical protein Acsp03_40720 [Actinomadura sp. NBRC 104412]
MKEFRYRRRRTAAAGMFLAGVVLVSLIQTARAEPDTAALVRDYLEAIKERDVGKALRIARVDRPEGEAGRFLVPEALDEDWTIVRITETFASDYSDHAEVTVVLAGEDRKRHESTVKVLKENGGLRIEEPLVTWRFAMTPLLYVEVGKVRIPFRKGPDAASVEYRLLPGFYRFYQGRPQSLVSVKPAQEPVLPGDGDVHREIAGSPTFTVTPAGQRAVSAAYNAFIDQCAKARGRPDATCPFGFESAGYVRTRDEIVLDPEAISWKVRKYPTIVALPGGGGLELVDRERGAVELHGIGRVQEDGPKRRFTVTCDALSNSLHAAVGMDGKISIIPAGRRLGQGAPIRETCRQAPLLVR